VFAVGFVVVIGPALDQEDQHEENGVEDAEHPQSKWTK